MDNTETALPPHVAVHTEKVQAKIDETKGDTNMGTPVNVFTPASDVGGGAAMLPAVMAAAMGDRGMGAGGAIGGGLGAGLVGGLLGGLLFGGGAGGPFGRNGGFAGDVVTTATLQSALNGQTAGQNTSTILQTLGDIKAAIPYNEGQVQLALAGAQADINSNISTGLQTAINGQARINENIATAIATSLASQSQIKDLVLTTSAGLQLQASVNTAALNSAIRDDGDKTRALIITQNDTMLNRELATAQAALLEQRAIGRSRDVEVNVTQTVNQNQMQLQAQQQQQQQLILLSQIAAGLNNVTQIAHATNSNVIAGNTGAVTTGAQTANPVNVNA